MCVKRCVSVVTATGFFLHTSGMAMALDLFGHEARDETQARIERNAEELARNRELIESLKREQRREEAFPQRRQQRMVRKVPPPESQLETEDNSSSWGNAALAAVVVGGLLWWLGSSSETPDDAGGSASGSGGRDESEYGRRKNESSTTPVSSWSDPSVGHFWGNEEDGTAVKSLWGTTMDE